ncbi:MAG: hypothetical protein R2795_21955 [Saprospiraceae bacterium]
MISEAVRGYGGILKTRSGEEFMHQYDSRLSLAPAILWLVPSTTK